MTVNLGRYFHVSTASSGAAGLEKLRAKLPFAVLMSDMRMPGLDGATLLKHAFSEALNTVRILLTGQSDLSATIAAEQQFAPLTVLQQPRNRR